MNSPLTDKESVERLEAIKARMKIVLHTDIYDMAHHEIRDLRKDAEWMLALLESSRERVGAAEQMAEALETLKGATCLECLRGTPFDGFNHKRKNDIGIEAGFACYAHIAHDALAAFRTPARKGAGA